MQDQQLHILVLAALLHDIGKFAQRAGRPKSSDQADMYCPTGEHGRPSHTHVLYSDYFIEHDLPLPDELNGQRSYLARLASSHHKPAGDDLFEQVLCVADRLSAGADRKAGEETIGDYKSARLLSIFEQLSFDGARPLTELQQGRYHRLEPLAASAAPVPLSDAAKTDYQALFDSFLKQLQELPLDFGVGIYLDALTSLLEEYTWCIPSSTYKSLSDISLYDHAVTTAAIAQALALQAHHSGVAPGSNAETLPKFRLLSGDLSGIQGYIFNLDKSHGSGVAKLFRARSFFLQALSRGAILALCETLGLLTAARIMDAGGRFLLLLPETDGLEETLESFELKLQQQMFEQFRGALSLNLDWSVTLTEKDFDMSRLRSVLDRANTTLEQRKLRKFDRLLAAGASPMLDLDFSAYADGDCSICHSHPVDAQACEQLRREQSRQVQICRHCADQILLLGTQLTSRDFLVFEKQPGKQSVPLLFGYHLRLEKSLQPQRDAQAAELVAMHRRGLCSFMPIATHLPTITDGDISAWKFTGDLSGNEADGWFMGDDPVKDGRPKTFAMLAMKSRRIDHNNRVCGRSFLGAFKADVDNLGLLFSVGLYDRLSLSRFATLSRMLNHFFSSEMVQWIKQDWPDLYVIFAGGDDLFLLGPWTDLTRFATELNQRFRQWVAERPDITLSAGLTINRPGLPVHSIAAAAEGALEESKDHSVAGKQLKNAVTLFNTTVSWEEFAELLTKGTRLLDWLDNGIIPRGLTGRLLKYGEMYRAFQKGDIKQGLYQSHMRYDFARNIDEKKLPDDAARAEILGIQLNQKLLSNIRLPVSYALYQSRMDH